MVEEDSESDTQEVTETWLGLSLCEFTGPSPEGLRWKFTFRLNHRMYAVQRQRGIFEIDHLFQVRVCIYCSNSDTRQVVGI